MLILVGVFVQRFLPTDACSRGFAVPPGSPCPLSGGSFCLAFAPGPWFPRAVRQLFAPLMSFSLFGYQGMFESALLVCLDLQDRQGLLCPLQSGSFCCAR